MMTDILSVLTAENLLFLLDGLKMTIFYAGSTILLSICLGLILALLRSYSLGFWGKLAAMYIEVLRNTPLILWILGIRFLTPIPPLWSGVVSLTLFETAIIAEIIRGGLGGIPKGQFEAGHSQGFTFLQVLRFIVVHQCFRSIVPALLSQVITIVKDSSFLWAVAIEEFTGKGMILMGRFTSTAQVFTLFALMAAVYFTTNFLLSAAVRRQSAKTGHKPTLEDLSAVTA